MENRRLGRSDLRVSSIGLGCVTFGREIEEQASFAVMDRALEHGITLFDTAEAYGSGRSEEVVGSWLAHSRARDEIVLATKVHRPLTREHILMAAEASLRRLRADVIDLYQLHAWDDEVALEESLEALNWLVTTGRVRYIGCSNFAAWQLCKALWLQDVHEWARMEAVQPNYNLVVRDIERELLPLCADQEIGVISYSPLGAGFLTGKYGPDRPVPAGTRMDIVPAMQPIYFHDHGFRVLEGLRARAAQVGMPMAQLALAWVMAQPGITAVLIGARNVEQLGQAVAAQSAGLSPELRAELSTL